MSNSSTSKRILHMAAAAAAVATFGVACGDDDGVNDDPFDQPGDPLAPADPGGIDPTVTDPMMDDPMTTDPMTTDPMTTDAGG